MNWYIEALKNYAVFSGRARRKEYWYFTLFNFIIAFVFGFISAFLGLDWLMILFYVYYLGILIPSLAVTIRRLHDTDHSGWWIFITFIPLVGTIIFFIFLVKNSTPGENQYGPNPKEANSNE